jgi:hypothetical protein
MDPGSKIPLAECRPRRLYAIRSRNLAYGVYDGSGGFIGIREKFGSRYLFTEYHWDQGPPFGTVSPQYDLGSELPEAIPLAESVDLAGRRAANTALFDWIDGQTRDGMLPVDDTRSHGSRES